MENWGKESIHTYYLHEIQRAHEVLWDRTESQPHSFRSKHSFLSLKLCTRMTYQRCPPCQTNYLHCNAGQQIWGVQDYYWWNWYLVSTKTWKVLPEIQWKLSQQKYWPGATFGIELELSFLEGLFILTWDDDTKHWDTMRELVLMEFSILHLGCSFNGLKSFEGNPNLYLLGFLQQSAGEIGRAQVTTTVPNTPSRWKCPSYVLKRLSQNLCIVTSGKESSDSCLAVQSLSYLCLCINYYAYSKC